MIDAAKIEELPGLLANQVVREVAELPDRTSPDDMPDMLMVTAQELHDIVAAVEATRIRALSAEKISADAYWQRKLLNWQKDEEALSTALASSEALVTELREKVERLTKALLRLQNGAAVALDALPEDQREGVVGNFLAAIHRECCAGLSAGQGADECKGVTP